MAFDPESVARYNTEDEQPRRSGGKRDHDEDETEEDISFCELCGCSEEDDTEELVRCEECGRLICSDCREEDADGTPYCVDCHDELSKEEGE